jgi:hypothetical protein
VIGAAFVGRRVNGSILRAISGKASPSLRLPMKLGAGDDGENAMLVYERLYFSTGCLPPDAT